MCTVKLALACCAPGNAALHDLLVKGLQRTGLQNKVTITLLEVATYQDYCLNTGKRDIGQGIASFDVLLTDPAVLSASMAHLLDNSCNLKWAHTTWAGVDLVTSTVNKLGKPIVPFSVTRQVGNFGHHMAEYVIGHIIARERDFFQQHLNQLEKKWFTSSYEGFYRYRLLSSLSIGIVGAGSIGREVARVCKSLGMTVCGLTREPVSAENTCPHIDHYKLPGELSELLEMSDYVCSILPETPDTKGVLDGDVLRHCAKKKSILINVGRGSAVQEDSIVKAIKQGWIGGAILDVFVSEPLPQDSLLWSMPEVTITPHCAAASKPNEVVNAFVDNLNNFLLGKPLKYQVDFNKGY